MLNSVKNLCLKVENPPENKRSYSSVYANNPIGTGHAQSMLESNIAWCPSSLINQWMKIHLEIEMQILGVIVQGRKDFNSFIKTFTVEYSLDDIKYIDTLKIYNGVTKSQYGSELFYDYVPKAFKAKFIKIYPKTWEPYFALRSGVLIDTGEPTKTNCISLQNNFFYDNINKIIMPCSADSSIDCGPCPIDYLPNYERTKCILKSTTEYYTLVNNYFHSCDISCRTCKTSTINCTRCNLSEKYYKLSDNPIICSNSIPYGYYADNLSESYKICDVSCETCVDTANKCLTCKSNYFFMEDQSNTCINAQSEGYYFNTYIQKMSRCDISCRTCVNSPTYCTECNYNNYYFPLINDRSSCKNYCPDFYFKNFINRECSHCNKSCKRCLDSTPDCQVFL